MAEEKKKDELKAESADTPQIPFYFKLRNVPNDHSCLFHSIGYLLDYNKYSSDINFHYELRNIVSNKISEEKEQYKQDLLAINKTAHEYSKWITDQFSWGGTMDASILAKSFTIDIVVIDVTSNLYYILNGTDHKSMENNTRLHIIYNGDHYDACVGIYNNCNDLDVTKEIRQFNLKTLNETTNGTVLNWQAIENNVLKSFLMEQHKKYKKKKEAMDKLKSLKKYECQECKKILKTNEEMAEHMNETEYEHCMFDEL